MGILTLLWWSVGLLWSVLVPYVCWSRTSRSTGYETSFARGQIIYRLHCRLKLVNSISLLLCFRAKLRFSVFHPDHIPQQDLDGLEIQRSKSPLTLYMHPYLMRDIQGMHGHQIREMKGIYRAREIKALCWNEPTVRVPWAPDPSDVTRDQI